MERKFVDKTWRKTSSIYAGDEELPLVKINCIILTMKMK